MQYKAPEKSWLGKSFGPVCFKKQHVLRHNTDNKFYVGRWVCTEQRVGFWVWTTLELEIVSEIRWAKERIREGIHVNVEKWEKDLGWAGVVEGREYTYLIEVH